MEEEIRHIFLKTKLKKYNIIRQLGKGKSGYSYLIEFDNEYSVLKLMHDEPCAYYTFGENKVKLEVDAHNKLKRYNIPMPKLIWYDSDNNYLVKDFIDGITASELIANNKITESIIQQLFEMYNLVKNAGLNIDYFPTNFIIKDQKLFYIDYECNPYSPEWNLPNWGLYYWANSEGFKKYLLTGNSTFINESQNTGLPIKKPFEEKVFTWAKKYNTADS